ncbi:MAG: hypothetical protein WD207_09360 [Xanthobacteraceae bacterium]
MTDKRNPGSRREQEEGRAERLAAALRANLRRRKMQARGRSAAGPKAAGGEKARTEREPAGE